MYSPVVPIVCLHDLILEKKMRSILSVAIFGGIVDHVSHAFRGSLARLRIGSIVYNVHNQMHFPEAHAEGRKHIQSRLCVSSFGDLEQLGSIFSGY